MKKLFTLLAVALCAVQGWAWDFKVTESAILVEGGDPIYYDLYYAYNEDGKTVSVVASPEGYNQAYYAIPDKVSYGGKKYTVTIIGANAFNRSSVQSLVMPNTIEEIQEAAVSGCHSLKVVSFSKGLKYIRNSAFSDSSVERIELFDGLESIGVSAFFGDYWAQLKVAILPSTLREIGASAFAGQSGLHTINIPEGIKEIKSNTFQNCKSLRSISLPSTVETIKGEAFRGAGLDNMALPNTVKNVVGYGAFKECPNLKSFSFSSSMTEIPEAVLSECPLLSKVTIPEGIVSIGKSAFSSCPLLSSISLPESVLEIGDDLFQNSGIQTVKLPSKLTSISSDMFSGCRNLTTITLPQSVTSIGSDFGSGAFYECISLRKMVIPEGVTKIGGWTFSGCTSLEEVVLPPVITLIGTDAFCNTKLTTMNLPKTLECIGGNAFYACPNFTSLHLSRAIPPQVGVSYYNSSWGENVWYGRTWDLSNEDAILYVPRGSKAAYEATGKWGAFKEIREEDVDGTVTYQVVASVVKGAGTLEVNGQADVAEVDYGGNAVVTVTPYTGYLLEKLICNGDDVTSEVNNGEYHINNVEANYALEASFREAPVTLTIRMGDGGAMGAKVEKYNQFTCAIVPEEGWQLNSVVFNGNDVTSQVSNGTYTTPSLTSNATLSISFEHPVSIASPHATASRMKAYVSGDGQLHIMDAIPGEPITVVTADGKNMTRLTANGSQLTLPLSSRGIYVIHTPSKDVKVSY